MSKNIKTIGYIAGTALLTIGTYRLLKKGITKLENYEKKKEEELINKMQQRKFTTIGVFSESDIEEHAKELVK